MLAVGCTGKAYFGVRVLMLLVYSYLTIKGIIFEVVYVFWRLDKLVMLHCNR